ncbi:MAG TPA: mucoidy inhibitor MuiA family protein [Gemmatales bacterium]|nr:mucoidy inhibitor MuiA family protein [Gemmatales bacterium]
MKRSYLFAAVVGCLGLIPFGSLSAHESNTPSKEAKSKITQVTVYTGNALITREVEVPEGTGLLEIIVTPLPTQVVDGSLYSEGSDGIRILTTRYRTRAIETDVREEVKKLNEERKKLQIGKQDMESKQKVLSDNLALLAKLEAFTAATMQQLTEKGVLSSDQTISLSKYIMDTRSTKSEEMTKIRQQIQANAEADAFVGRKLGELSAGPSRTERDAVITVNKANNAGGKIRLNYLVSSASWAPQYKFRAGKDKDPVLVEYLAAIRQQSGEEWANVNITLSTAQPMLNAAPPELKSLAMTLMPGVPVQTGGKAGFVGGGRQLALGINPSNGQAPAQPPAYQNGENNLDALKDARGNREKAQQEVNKKNFSSANVYWNEAAAAEQRLQLLSTKEEEQAVCATDIFGGSGEGPTVTYKLAAGISIPSRNDEQVVEVARLSLPPDYYYKAIPVLTKHVYRLANLTNKSDMVLLPGEATMYQGTDFVGRTQLPLVAIGENFTVGLGVDPSLQVARKLIDKTRNLKGANQELHYDYRILISSYKSEPVNVQVWDRLPMAETEVINISVEKAMPELSKDPLYVREERSKNLLRWDVKVQPNTFGEKAQTITYQFKMELDKQLQVGALTK